jgi:hypothetical protein
LVNDKIENAGRTQALTKQARRCDGVILMKFHVIKIFRENIAGHSVLNQHFTNVGQSNIGIGFVFAEFLKDALSQNLMVVFIWPLSSISVLNFSTIVGISALNIASSNLFTVSFLKVRNRVKIRVVMHRVVV